MGIETEEEVLLLGETINKAVLDCGASKTVCGEEWYQIFLESVSEQIKQQVDERPSNTTFRFGVGKLKASKVVLIPAVICEKKIRLEVHVVKTDIPLLLSLATMRNLGMNINFASDEVTIAGRQFPLETISSGHYAIGLTDLPEATIVLESKEAAHEIMLTTELTTAQQALKLHRRFAHASSARVIKLLKSAQMSTKEIEQQLVTLDSTCDFCLRHKRAAPRPKVSLPLAYEFNELVTMDLKMINGVWVLHCVDYVTRFSAGCVLQSKEGEEVVDKLFTCWISSYGPMKKLLYDNGGEFVNKSFKSLCASFNIIANDTASESPFQNGICERHNDLIGNMTKKIVEDVGCNLNVAYMWALHAKNSLISVLGFSPYQLVFGKNPNIPGNSNNALPAMSSYTTSQTVANHLNSLRTAREAYIKAENSDRVQRAMRGRVYSGTHKRFFAGDVIYYKRKGL